MQDDRKSAVVVKDVYKTFKIPVDQASGIKQAVLRFSKPNKGFREFKVLNDISFDIKEGEFFGIVGKNGSGKSTLLKLLAGIYVPDKGLVQVNGSLTPFIELGVGFNPELTGKENVFLNGALLGFDRDEVRDMYDEIVEFAELEDFMAEKLKNFSSGMQVRLAFSIAIRARSEILIMDEVLAVGDADFQKKCFNVFRDLKKQGKTIILVTHDMGNVERFCDRVLILNEGKMLTIAKPSKAASLYARLNIDEEGMEQGDEKEQQKKIRYGNGNVRVKQVTLLQGKTETHVFNLGQSFTLQLDVDRKPEAKGKKTLYGLSFRNEDGHTIAGPNSKEFVLDDNAKAIEYTIPELLFAPGQYSLTIALFDEETLAQLDVLEDWVHFSVIAEHTVAGLYDIKGQWKAE